MMNRPSSTDPYNVPIMPFASLDLTTTSIQRTSHPLLLGDWNSTNTTDTNNPSYNYSSLDCNPTLLPLNSFPFYSTPAMAEYPLMAMKSEEERGRIGLNLGHRTYFSSGDALVIDRLFGRPRGMYELAHHPPRCQAEGCKVDLSGAKHYHRRHKVCEFHSKASVVIAGGLQQRFCQQCSRFHVLSEFDEAKRSCRRRLADHNRRRRKPRPSTDSTAPKNNPTSSKDKSQHTQKSTKDISTTKASTSASVASISNASTSLEGQQVYQNKGTQVRNGPALSLGGVEKGNNIGAHGLYQCFSSPSSSSSSFFHHHNLFCSSSNEASQSTGGGSDHTHSHQQSNNLLHLGQAMFEVDFM